tara:strand:+ start:1489 stop:2082 length:594 start_codon:yes stop_codon:yes gene_type:complete
MKKIIKFILILLLLAIIIIFYRTNFKEENNNKSKVDLEEKDQINLSPSNNDNNLIKNLKYEINLDEINTYTITSDLGEIIFNDKGQEIIKMRMAKAIFSGETNIPLVIKSDFARYNTFNQNTEFFQNVNIQYLDKIISSDKMTFDFEKNLLTVNENVIYEDMNGNMTTDNIEINLITKKVEIYMNNNQDDVKINTKY